MHLRDVLILDDSAPDLGTQYIRRRKTCYNHPYYERYSNRKVTAITGVSSYIQYAEHYKEDGIGYFIAVLAITFTSATVFSFVVLYCFHYLNKKKQARIQKQLDEEEQDEL
jgi:hypothetical protein